MQHSADWAELLEPTLHDNFKEFGEQLPNYREEFFKVLGSKKSAEHSLGRGGISMMQEWNSTNRSVSYDTIAKGFKVDFTHKKYSNGLQVERELWDDDQFDEIQDQVQDLAFSVWYTQEYQAASVFNNAFNGGYVGADGYALCANAHPVVPGSSTTIDNYDTLVLNAANVEVVRNRMKAWVDDKGNLIPIRPDTLIVSPTKRKDAIVISDSEKEPDTTDNNINVWKGSLKVYEWDFLNANPNAWFLADSRRMKRYLVWWNRRTAKLKADGDNFDTELAKWATIGRWSWGWKSPTFIYGCEASA